MGGFLDRFQEDLSAARCVQHTDRQVYEDLFAEGESSARDFAEEVLSHVQGARSSSPL